MNLYLVHAKDLHYTEFVSHDFSGPSYDDGWVYEWVYAETPGKAKRMVFDAFKHHYSYLEFTDLKVKLQLKNVQYEDAGITEDYHGDFILLSKRASEVLQRYDFGGYDNSPQNHTDFIYDTVLDRVVLDVGATLHPSGLIVEEIHDFGPDWRIDFVYVEVPESEGMQL